MDTTGVLRGCNTIATELQRRVQCYTPQRKLTTPLREAWEQAWGGGQLFPGLGQGYDQGCFHGKDTKVEIRASHL